jgi:hypothetical protein
MLVKLPGYFQDTSRILPSVERTGRKKEERAGLF